MSDLLRKEEDGALLRESETPNANSTAATNPDSRTTSPGSRTLVTPLSATPPAASEPRSATAAAGTAAAMVEEKGPLFTSNESRELRAQWDNVQVAFVDEPRTAVQKADALVSATIKRLSEVFGQERQKLEQQWQRGGGCFHRRSSCSTSALPFVFYPASRDLKSPPGLRTPGLFAYRQLYFARSASEPPSSRCFRCNQIT
jgi:hypothetical protein